MGIPDKTTPRNIPAEAALGEASGWMHPAKGGHSMDKWEYGHKMMNSDTIRGLVSLLFPFQALIPHPEWDPHWMQVLGIKHSLQGAYSQLWEYPHPHNTLGLTEVLMVPRELQRNSNLPTLEVISQSSSPANQKSSPKKTGINQSQRCFQSSSPDLHVSGMEQDERSLQLLLKQQFQPLCPGHSSSRKPSWYFSKTSPLG